MTYRHLLVALALITSTAAAGGGMALVADPSGGALGLHPVALASAPFSSFLVPGVLLVLVVGGLQLVAAIMLALERRGALLWAAASGAVLMGWIGVQILMLREIHGLHLIFGGIGAVQILMAWRALGRRERRPGDREALAFLRHERIAFVGLSTKPGSFSAHVAESLRGRGHEVLGVNPRAAGAGEPGFAPSVTALVPAPRAALIMVAPTAARAVVEDCIAAGVQAVWFHRGVGHGSASEEAVARARQAGLLVVANACPMMFLEPVGWLHRAHRTLSADGAAA